MNYKPSISSRFVSLVPQADSLHQQHQQIQGRMVEFRISHYRVLKRLGAGGMGTVYKGEDTRLQRFVALKFLPDDMQCHGPLMARFEQEAIAASALNHPNICTIYDVGEENGQAFIAMEFLEGHTLDHLIQDGPIRSSNCSFTGYRDCRRAGYCS